MTDDAALKKQFHQEMLNTYYSAAKLGYRPTRFLQMINEMGGVEAAHRLISENISEGVTKLWELQRLDLSVEAVILKPEYHTLFSDEERAKARKILDDLGG